MQRREKENDDDLAKQKGKKNETKENEEDVEQTKDKKEMKKGTN